MECDQKRNWLKRRFWLNHLQPIFCQPVGNQSATSSANTQVKTLAYQVVDKWLTLVGCLKIALVGWGVCLRHPHRNHSTNQDEMEAF